MKALLVASPGGHLQQLVWMRPWWEQHERVFVTADVPDARAMLAGERILFAHHPTNRSVTNLARNLVLARQVLKRERPDVVVSTGAGVAVPFLWLARRYGARAVFVEPYDRVDGPSLSARMVSQFVDAMVLQRPEQQAFHPRGVLLGPVR